MLVKECCSSSFILEKGPQWQKSHHVTVKVAAQQWHGATLASAGARELEAPGGLWGGTQRGPREPLPGAS